MARAQAISLVVVSVLLWQAVWLPTRAAADASFVSSTCNAQAIPQGSAFWSHLGYLFTRLVENTPYTDGYSFKTRTGGGNDTAFGEASCNASCSPSRCDECLRQLSSDIWRICNSALGARVEYSDCWIRYECYDF